MLSVRLDYNSPLSVRWPRTDDEIIILGNAWVIYEASRNVADQLKDITLALVQTKLDAAIAARASAQSGEATRTITTGDYRTTVTTIRGHLDRALTYLKYKHANNLLLLEQWGWNIRHTARGGLTVRMPQTDADLLLLLERYVAHEGKLGAGQQITDPPFATLQALLVDVQDLAQNRRSSKVQRSSNVQARSTAARELLDLLQAAAINLCLLEFGGMVHPELANWGYTVVDVPSPKGDEDGGASEGEPPV